MSVVTFRGDKAEIDSLPENRIYQMAKAYAGNDPARWKRFTAMVLRTVCGYGVKEIALFVDDHKGHVSRQVRQAADELRNPKHDPQQTLF